MTSLGYTFHNCFALTSLDLSGCELNNNGGVNLSSTFENCSSLTKLDIRRFDFSKASYYSRIFAGIPINCEIIVKDDIAKQWVLAQRSDFTNVKTVAEYEA